MKKKLVLIPAAVLALGAAGAHLARADSSKQSTGPTITRPAADTGDQTDQADVQAGDQNAPDTAASTADTDTTQSGDQNTPDTGAADTKDAADTGN